MGLSRVYITPDGMLALVFFFSKYDTGCACGFLFSFGRCYFCIFFCKFCFVKNFSDWETD